jgi:hypothetical protein
MGNLGERVCFWVESAFAGGVANLSRPSPGAIDNTALPPAGGRCMPQLKVYPKSEQEDEDMKRRRSDPFLQEPRPKRTPKAMMQIIRALEAQGFRVRRGDWPKTRAAEARWDFCTNPRMLVPMNSRAAAAMRRLVPEG